MCVCLCCFIWILAVFTCHPVISLSVCLSRFLSSLLFIYLPSACLMWICCCHGNTDGLFARARILRKASKIELLFLFLCFCTSFYHLSLSYALALSFTLLPFFSYSCSPCSQLCCSVFSNRTVMVT